MDCTDYYRLSRFDYDTLDAATYADLVAFCPGGEGFVEFAGVFQIGQQAGSIYIPGTILGAADALGAVLGTTD